MSNTLQNLTLKDNFLSVPTMISFQMSILFSSAILTPSGKENSVTGLKTSVWKTVYYR